MTEDNPTAAEPIGRHDIKETVARLRAALAVSKSARSSDWEEATAKLVALTAVDYLKQRDDVLAFQQLALVLLAGTRGCKSARKRVMSPLRWREQPPPRLGDAFCDLDEAKAAVQGLSSLRAEWVVAYVMGELTAPTSQAIQFDLIQWAASNSPNLTSLLLVACDSFPPTTRETQKVLLDVVGMVLRQEVLLVHEVDASLFTTLVDIIGAVAKQGSAATTDIAAVHPHVDLVTQAVGAVDSLTALRPHLLCEQRTAALLRETAQYADRWSATTKHAALRIVRRVIDLLEYVHSAPPRLNAEVVSGVAKGYLSALSKKFDSRPEWEQLTRLASATADLEADGVASSAASVIEQSLAGLLVDWDSLVESGQLGASTMEIEQFGRQIVNLARQVHVERFGVPGDVVVYEPLQHYLTMSTEVPPLRVRIRKAGTRKRRDDGTFRVILKALADPK